MNELTQDEYKILVDAIHDSASVIHKGQIMNKRIQELMIEAGKTIPGDKHIDADFCKKFAELIVKECMEVAGASYTSTPEDCVYYVDLAVNRIAEHFGVEE